MYLPKYIVECYNKNTGKVFPNWSIKSGEHMEEIINKLLNGNFNYDNGSLDFSCSKVEIVLHQGECAEGSFYIYGAVDQLLEGVVSTSDTRMECVTPRFAGNGEQIFYRFNTTDMEEGDVVKGSFFVVSNQGEYYLPFVVSMEHMQIESSLGSIKNLFHFANLAKVNLDEASNLFYSPDFANIFTGNDLQYKKIYQGLSQDYGNKQNVEEFLISINKKQKIEYLTEESELKMEDPEGVVETILNITKNGWGYVELHVETEGDFLYAEKVILSDDDFLGNFCRLPIYIDGDMIHDGNNYGQIYLYNAYVELTVPVIVKKKIGNKRDRSVTERRRLIVQIMEYYQAFRMKKIGTGTWLKETGKLVDQLTQINENDVSTRLFQAQMLITEERYNEAQWILDHAADILERVEKENPMLWAYYLYLTTLLGGDADYVDKITLEVENIYRSNRGEWRIAWLLLYLSPEYSRSASKKILFLEEQFNRGCTSPIIYIEALLLINSNPTLLMKLGDFEKQILNYAAKNEFLTSEVIYQAVYLIQKNRDYSELLYDFLTACYRIKADAFVLQEICGMLIKGNKTGTRYYEWYKLGVEAELRITKLYEYFMMSIDLNYQGVLPKMVMMYFAYQSNLGYERNAFLYVNIYKNRERFPELYENYREGIERFVVEQIVKYRISRDLAYLYKSILLPRMITEEVAEALGRLLFTNLVQIDRSDIRQVVVYQPYAGKEYCCSVTDGQAFVPLFCGEYTLLFEDGRKNRYVSSVVHTIEKLMIPGKLVKYIEPLTKQQIGYDVFVCVEGKELAEVTEGNVERFQRLLRSPAIHEEYKRDIVIKLLNYFFDNDKVQELDEHLETIELEKLTRRERNIAIKLLVLRDKAEKAYQYICNYSSYGVEPKILMRLGSHMLQQKGVEESKELTGLLINAFEHGKYDEHILTYLVNHFDGMTKELRNIWKACVALHMDTSKISERILIQVLYTGSHVGEMDEIFHSYLNGEKKEEVIIAFLAQCAFDYFVEDKVVGNHIFDEIFHMHQAGYEQPFIARLAFVKYYAENKEGINEPIKEVIRSFIKNLLEQGIYLKIFGEFETLDDSFTRFSDKTIIEYKAHPDAKVIMHYVMVRETGDDGEYLTEEMEHVFGGVSVKTFVLFFGESIQYYIVEEQNGEGQLTESGIIQRNDISREIVEGKYNFINDIVIANALQDYETVNNLLEEYAYKNYIQENLFRIR